MFYHKIIVKVRKCKAHALKSISKYSYSRFKVIRNKKSKAEIRLIKYLDSVKM